MINYKDDTFYDQQTRKIFRPVKIAFAALVLVAFLFSIYSIISRKDTLEKNTFKIALKGEIRAFFHPKRGSQWMLVDGGSKRYDIEIGPNKISLMVGDSIYKLQQSAAVYIKKLQATRWELAEGQQFLLMRIAP